MYNRKNKNLNTKRTHFRRLWSRIHRDREKKEITMDELTETKRWVHTEKNTLLAKTQSRS